MEGKAPNTLLDYQAEAPETKDLFKHLRKDGKWIVRDDVFIKFLDRKGPLTIGYGSPGRTGVELEFGTMMAEVKETFDNYQTMFPPLRGKTLRLTGFVWFQGWNDQYGGAEKEYASNLRHFIRDVRKDLGARHLPFVIAAMGQNGSKPAAGALLTIREAQMSMNDAPEFQGSVKAFRTDLLVDNAAEALYPTWSKDVEAWKKIGGDHGYHYLGSAIWFNRIGKAMDEAMLELTAAQK